jgi:hypothetical protein
MITNIDPLQFDLMFERFLNPARISGERAKSADALPDIDLDLNVFVVLILRSISSISMERTKYVRLVHIKQ